MVGGGREMFTSRLQKEVLIPARDKHKDREAGTETTASCVKSSSGQGRSARSTSPDSSSFDIYVRGGNCASSD